METTERLPKRELDRQLEDALKATFPASDPVSIGEPSSTEPERPLERRPAAIDIELAHELAENLKAKHHPVPGPQPKNRP